MKATRRHVSWDGPSAGARKLPRLGRIAAAACVLSLGLLLPNVALAQEAPPQEGESAQTGILLNFEDAPLDAVLTYLSEVAGLVVVKEVDVEGRVSVISRQPTPVDCA